MEEGQERKLDMVMDKPVYLTAEGKSALEERLNHLKTVRRPEVADRIQQAKMDGDVSESGEYEDAKNEQAWVEGEIRDLEHKLQNAQIYQGTRGGIISLGSKVVVRDAEGEEYNWVIVGSADKVRVEAPAGTEEFAILKVE